MQRDLVDRARRGDAEAFEMLVRDGMPATYRRALAILGSEADARDATQEAFVAAWRELPRLRDPERYEAWLARIALNACRMTLRHRRRVREIPADGLARLPAAEDPRSGPVALAERDAVRRAFSRLPIEQRGLLVLHHVEGRSIREVATIIDVPAGTVKSRLHAARAALDAALRAEGAR
ncbi:MAG: sigma-70 family RNA polymerase sigma factor [Chloroflexota bacterium]